MSTSRKSSQVQDQSVNTNIQEDTMNTNTTNANTKYFNIVVASGRKVAVPEEMAHLILGVAKTALNEYTRKAAEVTIGKKDPRPKNPDSIKYDQNMLFRMQVMNAFITKVLEGVTIPEKDNTVIIDQLNNL